MRSLALRLVLLGELLARRGRLRAQTWSFVLNVAISVALIAAILMRAGVQAPGRFEGRIYGFAVGFEVVTIFLTVVALRRFGLQAFLMPAIGFIVGLHFIGLWKATDLAAFLGIAVAMCAVCVAAALLPDASSTGSANLRIVVAGIGSAVVLWAASAATLLHSGAR